MKFGYNKSFLKMRRSSAHTQNYKSELQSTRRTEKNLNGVAADVGGEKAARPHTTPTGGASRWRLRRRSKETGDAQKEEVGNESEIFEPSTEEVAFSSLEGNECACVQREAGSNFVVQRVPCHEAAALNTASSECGQTIPIAEECGGTIHSAASTSRSASGHSLSVVGGRSFGTEANSERGSAVAAVPEWFEQPPASNRPYQAKRYVGKSIPGQVFSPPQMAKQRWIARNQVLHEDLVKRACGRLESFDVLFFLSARMSSCMDRLNSGGTYLSECRRGHRDGSPASEGRQDTAEEPRADRYSSSLRNGRCGWF